MNGGAWKEIQVCGFSVIRYGEQDSPRDVRRTTDVTMNIQGENLKYQLYTFANSVIMIRGEWGYTGLISTDMMNNNYYFNPESMIMAGITQVADFATNDNHINLTRHGREETVANDAALVDQARENLKYQLYTFANSAVMNVSTERVQTWWDTAISTVTYASGVLAQMKLTGMAAAAGILRIAATVLLTLCLVTLITARVEGLGFIYFSNADVLQEVQTPANMSSAAGTIANMICLGAATVFSMIAAFFNLRKKETQN